MKHTPKKAPTGITTLAKRSDVDADDKALISFLLLYATEKYQWDIEAQLKEEVMERARRENEADRQRGEMQFAAEVAHNKRMRENSREWEIARAEAGMSPVQHVNPQDIF